MIDIKGYEGKYKITKEGKIFAMDYNKTGKIIEMKQRHSQGYLYIQLRKPGERNVLRVHRLIAESFIPKVPGKEYVNHINGIRDDNRIENLERCTLGENNIHKFNILGKKHSENQKRIFGENKAKSKKIKVIDSLGNENIYKSLRESMRETGINNHSGIIKAARNNILYKGYRRYYI